MLKCVVHDEQDILQVRSLSVSGAWTAVRVIKLWSIGVELCLGPTVGSLLLVAKISQPRQGMNDNSGKQNEKQTESSVRKRPCLGVLQG